MWIINLILAIVLFILLLYMFVRMKMYVDTITNALEDYINGIKDATTEAFKKLWDK